MKKSVKIEEYNGSPSIMIDGVPYPPMMATVWNNSMDGLFVDEKYYKALGESGIKIYFLICDTEWLKPDGFDLLKKEAEILLRAVPDAYIMLRIGMHPPLSWCEENPDELVQYSDGEPKLAALRTESYEKDYPQMYSLCSEKWREDAGKALIDTHNKIKELPYAERIIGYFFAAGGTSEWYYITPTEYTAKTNYKDTGGFGRLEVENVDNVYGDLSPAFKTNFVKYLKAKYKTDEVLQKAWKNDSVTLDNPYIPDCTKRYYIDGVDYDIINRGWIDSRSGMPETPSNGTNIGHFIDIDNNTDVYDFFRAWHKGVADSVIYFGNVIKSLDENMLTGAFYGAAGSTKPFAFGQIGSVTDILKSGKIDFLASPGVYENRQPGGFTGQRQCFDSYRINNRIFVVEDDARTHLEKEMYRNTMEMFDIEDTYNVLKREFGRNICTDVQAWWFDQTVGGGRYKDKEIYKLIEKQQKIAKEAYEKDRRKVSEVAFIYDEDSYHLIASESTHQMTELFNNYEIDKIGLPSDRYFKSDFFNEKMPDYKLYVFLNALCMNEEERNIIKAKLRKNNATALFMYGCGIVDFEAKNKFSIENCEKITGIKMAMNKAIFRGKFKVEPESHEITKNLKKGEIYGDFKRKMWSNISSKMSYIKDSEVYLCPLIYTDDEDSKVLAYFADCKKPALTLKEQDGYTSIYCGSKYLSCDVIKEIARFAGCHIYSETEDVLYANRSYITIHAAEGGEKTINLPGKCDICDVYNESFVIKESEEIHIEMYKGETRMFKIR